ncbi:DNA methyltransferase [Pseudomonas lopnurensis]|uniref:DNA methyltransferase n=1 Tax=Pseudomonas lopnurensis TaxID=1477517 RepID=UPI0028B0CA2D|nr:DNA methyltransferase [Pseudomonas lopnurensis]
MNANTVTGEFTFTDAPAHWADKADKSFSSLHQLSPYIGKLKPNIARELIVTYTQPGQLVVDPFCGSGTVPLEAILTGREVIASDSNPYAFVLTKAKLSPPASLTDALSQLEDVYEKSTGRSDESFISAPDWVRSFFHPDSFRELIKFADECLESRNWFLLSCLLGILHHQRPGFLSYPSSHLVPYLRDKKYPKSEFPEMYEYRALLPRMRAKLTRAFKSSTESPTSSCVVKKSSIEGLILPGMVDAIITSPPYMNALDYRRDNRLRLWILDRSTQDYFTEPTDKAKGLETMVSSLVNHALSSLKPGGIVILVVGETVIRKRTKTHPSRSYIDALLSTGIFRLISAIRDNIPDIRRSRKAGAATKAEHILVFQKIDDQDPSLSNLSQAGAAVAV